MGHASAISKGKLNGVDCQAGQYEATVLPWASMTSQDSLPWRGGISDFFPSLMEGTPLTNSMNIIISMERVT